MMIIVLDNEIGLLPMLLFRPCSPESSHSFTIEHRTFMIAEVVSASADRDMSIVA